MWYSKERVHDDYQAIEYVVVVMFRLCYSLMSIVLIITYMTSLYYSHSHIDDWYAI